MSDDLFKTIYSEYRRIYEDTPAGMMYSLLFSHATKGMSDEQVSSQKKEINDTILAVMQQVAKECRADICAKTNYHV